MKTLFLSAVLLVLPASLALACALPGASPGRYLAGADAVFAATVRRCEPHAKPGGQIETRVVLRVDETFKGRAPELIELWFAGGMLEHEGQAHSASPRLVSGKRYLLFASRRPDGTLGTYAGAAGALELPSATLASLTRPNSPQHWLRELRAAAAAGPLPGADVTGQAATAPTDPERPLVVRLDAGSTATNLFVDSQGLSGRLTHGDTGDPIPYLLDVDFLPAGVTVDQARAAVERALAAWSNATSLKFTFRGFESFGQAASAVRADDGVLRIQLHDAYHQVVAGGETLGLGGIYWSSRTLPAGWTTGGMVKGNDFHRVTSGWVLVNHTSSFNQNLDNLAEILCHEIGHALSLDHSSIRGDESNPVLKQAIMYFNAHGNGRGPALGTFDTNVVSQIYPRDNTPPFCYPRVIDAITTPTTRPGMAPITFTGYDRQTTNLTLAVTDASSSNGRFSVSGRTISFDPDKYYSDSQRMDPAENVAFDLLYARFADGTNASPYQVVKVVSFNQDTYHEGIPDAWRTTYFGSADPSAGVNRHAWQDFDHDGLSNLREYWLGSSPADPNSNLRVAIFPGGILQWPAKPYEVYEILGTTNFVTWQRISAPVLATNTLASVQLNTAASAQFLRVSKVQ